MVHAPHWCGALRIDGAAFLIGGLSPDHKAFALAVGPKEKGPDMGRSQKFDMLMPLIELKDTRNTLPNGEANWLCVPKAHPRMNSVPFVGCRVVWRYRHRGGRPSGRGLHSLRPNVLCGPKRLCSPLCVQRIRLRRRTRFLRNPEQSPRASGSAATRRSIGPN